MDMHEHTDQFDYDLLVTMVQGNQKVFRVIHDDDQHVYVVHIGKLDFKSVFRPREIARPFSMLGTWGKNETLALMHAGALQRIHEVGIPDLMSRIWTVPRGKYPVFDRRRDAVNYMLDKWGKQILSDRNVRCQAVQETSLKFGAEAQTVRLWLVKHYFYGGHPAALKTRNELISGSRRHPLAAKGDSKRPEVEDALRRAIAEWR